jgi:DNA polymerase III subunit epsilon
MEPLVVIDFETTGLSPDNGDRSAAFAAVSVRDGRSVDRSRRRMNAARRIPAFIAHPTGVADAMVRDAPPAQPVMAEVAHVGGDDARATRASASARPEPALSRIGSRPGGVRRPPPRDKAPRFARGAVAVGLRCTATLQEC